MLHIFEPDRATRQAAMTANYYMEKAVDDIDGLFGDGYAKANPALVAAYMAAAAADFAAVVAMME